MHHSKQPSRILLILALMLGVLPSQPLVERQDFSSEPEEQPHCDFFPVSVWYGGGRARAPMVSRDTGDSREAWKQDLAQIRSLGFNTVRCWVEWTSSEPVEGKYDFSALNLLCDLATEVGLKVIVQAYVDSAPEWVGAKFPDAKFVTQSGAEILSQAAPGFCFDHPGVQKATLRFLAAAAEVLRQKPAFYGWDLWSEPHIINWAVIQYVPNAQFCFCPNSVARFRRWLQTKYGTLEKLNTAWYRTYTGWSQVEPPRFGTILSYTDFIDWKKFIANKLAEDLALRSQAVRRADSSRLTTSHAAIPAIFTSPFNGDGVPDDWQMARSVDYYGTSIYPKHASSTAPWATSRRALAFDFIRSMTRSGGGFYVGELQAGFGTTGTRVSEPVTADDLRNWMWSAIASGARGINIYAYYPMSSGYESGGYGLINLDGTITERARAAGDVARLVNQYQALLLTSRPAGADVAILYDPLSHMVGGEQSVATRTTLRDSLAGFYRALYESNISVDFVHAEDMRLGTLSKYRLLIVPYPVMMAQSTADAIRAFVQEGGAVFSEARLAWNDERGYAAQAIPGFSLHEVFGAQEDQVLPAERTKIFLRPANDPSSPFKPGMALEGTIFEESFRPISPRSAVLGQFADGLPALIESRYGKGKTLLVGSFMGLAQTQHETRANSQFFQALIKWAGITPVTRVETRPPGALVEVRRLEGDRDHIVIVFNRSSGQVSARIELKSTHRPSEITELAGQTKVPFQYKSAWITLNRELSRNDILVLRLSYAGE